MDRTEKFVTFLAILFMAAVVIWIGAAVKDNHDKLAAAEGRYCLIANGSPVWTMCIDKDAK